MNTSSDSTDPEGEEKSDNYCESEVDLCESEFKDLKTILKNTFTFLHGRIDMFESTMSNTKIQHSNCNSYIL